MLSGKILEESFKKDQFNYLLGLVFNWEFKVLVLGTGGSGKTSLLLGSMADEFKSDYSSSLGVNFTNIKVQHEENNLSLTILEIMTNTLFGSLMNQYYFGSQAAVILYDVTKRTSYDQIPKIFDDFIENSKTSNPVIMFVGNKIDQAQYAEDAISEADHEILWNELSEKYPEAKIIPMRTSLKENEACVNIIHTLCEAMFDE